MSFEKQSVYIKNMLDSDSKELKIDLSNLGLSDDKVKELVGLINAYPNREIKLLNLYGNDITDVGAKSLSELKNVIIELNLCYNRIKNEGAKSLISNEKFRQLDLSDNNITDNCAEFIFSIAKQVHLNLTKNKISSENLAKISNVIRDNLEKSKDSNIVFFKSPENEKKAISSESYLKIEQPEILVDELIKVFEKHNVKIEDRLEIPKIIENLLKQNLNLSKT